MKTFITNTVAWVKAHILISIVILFTIVLLFFPKLLRKLTGTRRRVHHRTYTALPARRRRRSIPRSVGMHETRRQYTKGGKAKKAWQIKGSLAAKRHMAQIRRMR